MYGNGVRIGTADTAAALRLILLVQRVGLAAWIVVAAGSIEPSTAALPIAAAVRQASATSISGCASPSPSNKSWVSALSASKLSGYELMASGQKKR